MLCGNGGFGYMQQPRSCKSIEAFGERGQRAGGRLFVVQPRQLGDPIGLADDQPAQLHDRLLQDRAQVVGGKGGQVGLQIGGVGQRGDAIEERRHRALQRVVHDRQQQFLLVAEVLVDRLLGDLCRRGDLVDAGALVAVAQEQRPARRQDGLTLARRTAQHLGHVASSDGY